MRLGARHGSPQLALETVRGGIFGQHVAGRPDLRGQGDQVVSPRIRFVVETFRLDEEFRLFELVATACLISFSLSETVVFADQDPRVSLPAGA